MFVFVPLDRSGLDAWASEGVRAVDGFAATPGFLAAFDVSSADSEDADRTLLEVAGLAGLLRHGERLVAVCECRAHAVDPPEFGAVHAGAVPFEQVEALFVDDEHGREAAASLRGQIGAAGLDEAWDAEATHQLLRTTELLWHDVTEWRRLTH